MHLACMHVCKQHLFTCKYLSGLIDLKEINREKSGDALGESSKNIMQFNVIRHKLLAPISQCGCSRVTKERWAGNEIRGETKRGPLQESRWTMRVLSPGQTYSIVVKHGPYSQVAGIKIHHLYQLGQVTLTFHSSVSATVKWTW